MDLNQKIIAAILAGFFLIALLRVFSAPLKLALKLLGQHRPGLPGPVGGGPDLPASPASPWD